MLNVPPAMMTVLLPLAPLFQGKTWQKVPVLLIGMILTLGKRTVTAALRVMGLTHEGNYAKYQQVLNRATWSPLAGAERLLGLLVKRFCWEDKLLVFGIDESIERRWGQKIAAGGIYRDAVRSSGSHMMKASGLRWVSVMLLTPFPGRSGSGRCR